MPAIPEGLARIVDVARGCRATEGAANVEMVTVLRGGVHFPSLEEPPLQGRLLAVEASVKRAAEVRPMGGSKRD